MAHRTALIIHGHFYQPPREDPWTGIVECEPSAAPFHDWNERVHAECYRPNGWARVIDGQGRVVDVVNNYQHLSFNVGPTLLSWLERNQPATLARIVAADAASLRDRGHGNAIAQAYNHAILPLMNARDMRSQIKWGIADFEHRFARRPASLWLPETACNHTVLDALIDAELDYVLLAPNQAARVETSEGGWRDVSDGSVDPGQAYRYKHSNGSGASIAVFFYDGGLSRAVAFEGALSSSRGLVDRFVQAAAGGDSNGDGRIIHVVTDGESYGHHAKFGDRCLAHTLTREATERGFWVTNYAAWLEKHPAQLMVELKAGEEGLGTSWSCAHGVGRWLRDCGCQTGGAPGVNQRWRLPLRQAFDRVRDETAGIFECELSEWCDDPWALRDAYIELLLHPEADRANFFERHCQKAISFERRVWVLKHLEAQRASMLMYTSCGWFFNELSGIETLQVMRYAGLLVDRFAQLGHKHLQPQLTDALAQAHSNLDSWGNGAQIYAREVAPKKRHGRSMAAHLSLATLCAAVESTGAMQSQQGGLAGFDYVIRQQRLRRHGRLALCTALIQVTEQATGMTHEYGSCAVQLGVVELHCLLSLITEQSPFDKAAEHIWQAFEEGSLLKLLRVAEHELGPSDYGMEKLLPSERKRIATALFSSLKSRFRAQYETIYQDAARAIKRFHEAGLPLPEELRAAAQLALSQRFEDAIEVALALPFEESHYDHAAQIADEAARYGCSLRATAVKEALEQQLARETRTICLLESTGSIAPIVAVASRLRVQISLEPAREAAIEALAMANVSARDEQARRATLEILQVAPRP